MNGAVVKATVNLSSDLTTVSLVPDAPLQPGIPYRIVPGSLGAEDLAGNNLSGSQTTFTTAP